ncbi:MAG: hypothetical protein CMH64_01200 [Nanoarchaeota archaeon]|nr:hypothetical protein [Nanoarchaeota archaeon]|tara:strand:- start:41 stop:325 length:285 start_codon:yes stop_codon:yes gene_type:complete
MVYDSIYDPMNISLGQALIGFGSIVVCSLTSALYVAHSQNRRDERNAIRDQEIANGIHAQIVKVPSEYWPAVLNIAKDARKLTNSENLNNRLDL